MYKFRIIKITPTDKDNGFVLGQTIEGEIKKVKRLPPFNGTLEVLEVRDSDFFIMASQVEKI